MSSRRLRVLIKHLPPGSAVNREIDGESAEWSVTDYLLAAVVDHLAVANWMFTSVHSDEPPDPPEPVIRPGLPGEHEDTDDRAPGGPGASTGDVSPPDPAELARFFS